MSAPSKGFGDEACALEFVFKQRTEKWCREQSAGVRRPAAGVAKQMGCRVLNQLQFLRSCLDNEHHSTQAYRS